MWAAILVAVNPEDAARVLEGVHGEMAGCPMLEIPGQPGRPVLSYLNVCCMSQAVHMRSGVKSGAKLDHGGGGKLDYLAAGRS